MKLYRCFEDGLKICMYFFQNSEIIFCFFFPFLTKTILGPNTAEEFRENVPFSLRKAEGHCFQFSVARNMWCVVLNF